MRSRENYENFKAKVVSCRTHKTEQARGGPEEMHVHMEVDHVSASEPEEEDLEDVDEVRRRSICYNCRMMELFAKDFRRKGKGKGRGADGSKAYAKGKGKTMNGAGKTGADISGGHKGGPWGDVGKLGIPRTELDARSQSGTRRQCADCRGSGGQSESEEDGEVGGVSMLRKRKMTLVARGAHPSTGQMKILTVRKEKVSAARGGDPSAWHMEINAKEKS